jgi:predicted small metal-binding protein
MTHTVDCFALGFTCESAFRSADRGEVLDQVLAHIGEQHGTNADSSGFRDFVAQHIDQVDDDAAGEASSIRPGHRRATRRAARITTRIAERLARRSSQFNPVEEHTP